MGIDYYGVLELPFGASDEEVKKAYRRLALKYHPKRSKELSEGNRFALICEAYDLLTNPEMKAVYEQYGEAGLKLGVPIWLQGNHVPQVKNYSFHGDCERVFREFFGTDNPYAEYFIPNNESMGRCMKNEGKATILPSDLMHDLELSLEELFTGCMKRLKYERKIWCDDGTSTMKEKNAVNINIAPGCHEGEKYVFHGLGNQTPTMAFADLIVVIREKPHPLYRRDENDLHMNMDIPLCNALTGWEVTLETLDGKRINMLLNEIITPGYKKVLPRKGMPVEGSRRYYGNLIIHFNVVFPKVISAEQRASLKKAFMK